MVTALGIGFAIGVIYQSKEIELAYSIATAAKVIQEDKVLSLIESGNLSEAKRIQSQFLESSLLEWSYIKNATSQEAQNVVLKRNELMSQMKN
jgi:Flp pilus assembly protein TadD